MIRSYSVRLRVTRRQNDMLVATLAHLCELYNAALQERRDAWKVCQKNVGYYDQQAELTALRAVDPESASFPVALQRDPLRRVARAFDGFFRRVRQGGAPGYPRFRSRERYDSFAVDAANFRVDGSVITISRLGGFRFKSRRELPRAAKALHVKRVGNKWQAVIVCDIGPARERKSVSTATGIDVGVSALATLSDGTVIENPRWTKQEAARLAVAQRSMARKQKGSRNRSKARERVRRIHQRIRGLRRSYLHSVSSWLLARYDLIAYEKLNITSLAQGHLSKSILDAAWGELIWQLTYKAESAGAWLVPVNPRGTTQLCSGCGTTVPKSLSERQHSCPECGLTLGRDHNAAINVLQRGLRCADVSQNAPSCG